MSADDHYDGLGDAEGHHGEVHGLLATAFADDMPAVNLVPTAVDGYRRHRRRTRVLGSAGGALALAGVIAAGTTLVPGAGSTTSGAPSAVSDGGAAADGNAVPAAIASACTGNFYLFGQYNGSGVYTSDQQGLAAHCRQDLTGLQALTGDRTLTSLVESQPQAITHHDTPAGSTPPPPGDYIQPGYYDGRINGVAYRISIFVSDKTFLFGNSCTALSCPPNRTLADGVPATEVSTGAYNALVIHYDIDHSVVFSASLTEHTTARNVPFDFEKLIASPGFARLISTDVRTLNRLTHPA
ncbi:hypothetical protein ABH935_008002 [Catenulispora sp. GAS73]|uniref:hypothetical protein n=1 Tax=Catenulispora sp. GAS73 TaxID=3156269 RepID=UPI003518ED06